MDVLEELLQQGLSLVIFCVGVTVLLLQFHDYMDLMEGVRELNKEVIIAEQKEGNVGHHLVEEGYQVVSKGELISYLLHQLEYDMEIDGVRIRKTENSRGNIASYEFHSDYYKKGYRYDENGLIKAILFYGVTLY